MTSGESKETVKSDGYQVVWHADIADFMTRSQDWLTLEEVKNNSLLSLAKAIYENKSAYSGSRWFATIERADQISGCALFVTLDGLVISHLPKQSIPALVDELVVNNIEVAKVTGPHETCIALAKCWTSRFRSNYCVSHVWQGFKLETLIWPSETAPGSLRIAHQSERELVGDWGERYGVEKPAPISVSDFLLSKLDDGELYIWDDLGPKMLICVSGRTKKCAGISAVYTPPENRRRGYATSSVAAVTKMLLGEGRKYTTLLVDIADAHVMRIYERLGYEKIDLRSNILISPPK